MKQPRNPFRSLKVESIESHDLFLKLFQPLALGALDDNPWDSIQVIRSAQGGGKTSLLRVLTPECLRRVADGTSPYLGEIADQLKRIGAIADYGPTTLGLYIPLGSTPYATLARCRFGDQDPIHLFYALLDARIILTAVRGLRSLSGLYLDSDIDRIAFHWPLDNPNRIYELKTASELVDWAKTTERDIWKAIDRGDTDSVSDKGHSRPYAFEALSHKVIYVDGKIVCDRVLVMVDDAHKLETKQRNILFEYVITSRLNVSVWVAERMHAMEQYELLALGTSSSAREYQSVVLSHWWQHENRISKFYNELATKRLHEAGIDTPFDQLVSSGLIETKEKQLCNNAIININANLYAIIQQDKRFSDIELGRNGNEDALKYLIDLKAIELYVYSVKNSPQTSFDFDASVPDPNSADLSRLRPVAEYQVCIQNNLPLYYSAPVIYNVASWNIDQLLNIAASIFAQYDAQRVRNTDKKITASVQDKIIRQVARTYWDGLPKRMPGGEKMQRFLQAFAIYALEKSRASTAKYPPGVTGFGITSRDHDRLRNHYSKVDEHLSDLAELLSNAVAHNVLFMHPNSKQGKSGETVTIFYLNRLLCVYFELPIGLGGWWKRKVDHFADLLKTKGKNGQNSSDTTLFEDRKLSL